MLVKKNKQTMLVAAEKDRITFQHAWGTHVNIFIEYILYY